jgi:hypothetical protein
MGRTLRARDNPFRTERVRQVRYRLQGVTWAELLARCERLHYRAALIGPHGSGKTTLLEELESRFRERGFGTRLIRLDEEHRAFKRGFVDTLSATVTARDIVLFDGAEQMNPFIWRWFHWQTRHTGGLIITTHRAGRLPTLYECRTSPDLLAGIAADLLEVESGIIRRRAEALFHKYCGNVREALREWYDLLADGRPATDPLPVAPPGIADVTSRDGKTRCCRWQAP